MIEKEISIPPDNDGYILLQCPNCNDYFKLLTADCNNDEILDVRCPSCGLISDSFITEEVYELAMIIARNIGIKHVHSELQKILKKISNNKTITYKAGTPPQAKHENPIYSNIDALSIVIFTCCNKPAKIKPLLKISGCCCPFCGVKNYEFE